MGVFAMDIANKKILTEATLMFKPMIYEIAGLRIGICNRYAYTTKFCQNYLSEDQDSPADIFTTVTQEEFDEEKSSSEQFSDGYIENICLYRNICCQLPRLKRLLLHASVVDYRGEGYAFLGRSGTGKSTHTRLWLQYLDGTRVINGDKPILRFDGTEFIVYGTPWNGKEGLGCNASVPLKGLCFLEQAKENSIRRLTHSETSKRLFSQVLLPQDEDEVVATLELLDKMIASTPAYLLQCDISEQAVKSSFEAMTKQIYSKKED